MELSKYVKPLLMVLQHPVQVAVTAEYISLVNCVLSIVAHLSTNPLCVSSFELVYRNSFIGLLILLRMKLCPHCALC